jgi:protein phosphatase
VTAFFETEARQIDLTVFGKTDPGRRRSENQDSFLVFELRGHDAAPGYRLGPTVGGLDAVESARFALGAKGLLAMVADGMGGAAGGATASRLAIQTVHDVFATAWAAERNHSPQSFTDRLRSAIEAANARIHAEAATDPALRGMGTTATAVGILEGILYLAQVGDSRAYLVREGRAVQLTRDQSVIQDLIDAGAVLDPETESGVGNMITQALGTRAAVEVDLTYQEARRGDVLVICSDGLYRVVQPAELAAAVVQVPDPHSLCEALIDLANDRGAPDNVTVVVARIAGEGVEPSRTGDTVGRIPLALARD